MSFSRLQAEDPTGERERIVLNAEETTKDAEEEEYYSILLKPPQSPSDSCVPVGGRLGDFLPQTNATSSLFFILKLIENGYRLEFSTISLSYFFCYQEKAGALSLLLGELLN